MLVIRSRDVPRYRAPKPSEREIGILVAPQLGNYDKATIAYVKIPPEGSTGLHKHDTSDELIYVLSGEGEFVEVSDVKEEVVEVQSGHLIITKSNTLHLVRNKGPIDLELFCVFLPPITQPVGALAEAINRAKEYFREQKC